MADLPASTTCPRCGAAVSGDAMGGLCPQCVARRALAQVSEPGGVSGDVAGTPPPARLRYFGDYELLAEIGRGGMGVVYRARQVSLNRFVAVKMLLHGDFASDEFVRRFRAEAEAAASLQHPNIVRIHEIGTHEGQHYFSMDHIEGPSLEEIVRAGALPLEPAARYVRQMAEAIQYAHDHGIIHRDLKPSNVLIDPFDQPRITDFGLAKRLGGDSQLTLPGQVLGAPAYMAPEQAAGRTDQIGIASDVYALGAILYHLVTGRPPFQGESLTETLVQAQQGEPVPPRAWNPAVPRDLEAICLKCLEKRADRRYASAAALAGDLRRWQADEPVLAWKASPVERAWRAGRRHPTAAVLVLLVVLGAAGTGAFWPRPPPLRIPAAVSELIVYTDTTVAPTQVCITDPTGAFRHRLPIRSPFAVVSPDGRRLCYLQQDTPRESSLWLCRLDGGGRRRLVATGGPPTWLDDRTVLYESFGLESLWAVDVETRQTRKVFDWSAVTTRGRAGHVEVSPDRQHLLVNPQNLVFSTTKGEYVLYAPTADLYVCDLDGSQVRVVWEDAGDAEDPERSTTDCRAVWLGGDRIAWCRHARTMNRVSDMAVVSARLGDTNLQALTGWKGFNYPLAASPDGERLLYATEDAPGGGNLELWTMKADGSDRRRLLDEKFGCEPNLQAHWFRRQP